jgi:hypothetical protein
MVPLAIIGFAFGAEKFGHQWNIHGDAAALIVLFFFTGTIALVLEIMALLRVLPELRQEPAQRTPINLLCVGFAALFVAAALAYVLYALSFIARP